MEEVRKGAHAKAHSDIDDHDPQQQAPIGFRKPQGQESQVYGGQHRHAEG